MLQGVSLKGRSLLSSTDSLTLPTYLNEKQAIICKNLGIMYHLARYRHLSVSSNILTGSCYDELRIVSISSDNCLRLEINSTQSQTASQLTMTII